MFALGTVGGWQMDTEVVTRWLGYCTHPLPRLRTARLGIFSKKKKSYKRNLENIRVGGEFEEMELKETLLDYGNGPSKELSPLLC